MARPKSLASICREAAGKPTIEEKVSYLRQHGDQSLVDLLTVTFDPRFTFRLPRGAAPYKKIVGLLDQEGRLRVELKHMGKFCAINGHSVKPELKQLKLEMLFLQMLESIDPEDAEMMVSVKDKKLPWKGLTARTAQMAFPQIYIGESKGKKEKETDPNEQDNQG